MRLLLAQTVKPSPRRVVGVVDVPMLACTSDGAQDNRALPDGFVSARRSSLVFGAAIVVGNLGQAAWLVAGARVFDGGHFGIVLTAGAMYGVLQMVVDNGAGFHGARLAARDDLGVGQRNELAHARLLLALAGAFAGLLLAGVGGVDLLRAFAPYAAALPLFALLNVWEPYGEERMLPLAAYLVLRSVLLAAVVGAAAIAGAAIPLALVGLCEVAAIGLTATVFATWLVPHGRPGVGSSVWRSIFDIGSPALVVQYNFAVATIILGVTGRTVAAAVAGVALRLLNGMQSINGIAVTVTFPRLARNATGEGREARLSRISAWGIVAVSGFALLATAMCAPLLARGFLDSSRDVAQSTIVIAMSAAAATGLVMHQCFALVARGLERELLRAALSGAVVITGAGALAGVSGSEISPAIAVAGFALGQTVTLILLRRAHATGAEPGVRSDRALLPVAGIALPLLGVALALAGETRLWIAGGLAIIGVIGVAATRPFARPQATYESL